MSQETVTPKRPRRLIVRVLAVLLAVSLLMTGVLYNAGTVLLSADTFDRNASVLAARQLLESNEYASLGALGRMSMYMQHYLSVADSYEEYEEGAAIAVSREKYEDALACTDQSIACCEGGDEELANLYLRKGYLYVLLEQYENAEEWLDRGIELNETPAARITRAQVRLNLGNTEGALEDVTAYINTADNALEMLPNLINVYEAAGDYQTAADCYTRLLESEEHADCEYYLDRASCYVLLGDMESARADCESYISLGGEDRAEAGVMLGIGYLQSQDYEKASEAFLDAVDDGYENPEALDYYLMLCAYVGEDYTKAAEYGSRAVESALDGTGGKTVALQLDSAVDRLRVTLTDFDVSTLCLITGASYMQTADYESAVTVLTDCLSLDGSTAYVNYLRGNCLLSLGRYEEALEDFNAAVAADQETVRSIYGRSICWLQLGDIDAAAEDFRYVLLHSDDEELLSSTRQMMSELGLEE